MQPVLMCFTFLDVQLLLVALKDLTATTRKLRKALWCALQMTLPRPAKRAEHYADQEATPTERYSSPFEGYTFKLGFNRQ